MRSNRTCRVPSGGSARDYWAASVSRVAEPLLANFAPNDQTRVETLLDALVACLDLTRTTFAGGIATRFAASCHAISTTNRPLNDIDLLIPDLDAVSPKVVAGFRISHSHIETDGHPYFAIVHPEARLKADIFGRSDIPQNRVSVAYKAHSLLLSSPIDQLIADLRALELQLERQSISPKRFDTLRLLLSVIPPDEAENAWQTCRPGSPPIAAFIAQATALVLSSPSWIREHEFEKPQRYECPNCVGIPGFPLTPLDEIRSILDIVE